MPGQQLFVKPDILRRPDVEGLMLRESVRRAVGQYNVLIVNRHLSQCRHPLLGILHPVFLPGLVNYPGRLCISHMWPALFSCQSHRNPGAADGVLTACQSRVGVGGRLIRGSQILDVFSASKSVGQLICGSPYTREYTVTGFCF